MILAQYSVKDTSAVEQAHDALTIILPRLYRSANLTHGQQCRFNHGPNGPVARAPELQAYPGGPGSPTGMLFTAVLVTLLSYILLILLRTSK